METPGWVRPGAEGARVGLAGRRAGLSIALLRADLEPLLRADLQVRGHRRGAREQLTRERLLERAGSLDPAQIDPLQIPIGRRVGHPVLVPRRLVS